ncbi:Spore germination protein GerM [Alkalithermobacter thermoalcaliphilus JW-YL-7 = DSM 7308]|uniref:Lipoprotein LpqB, GerMN domain-containing protein n=1 Tax=Alkalithermobacter thermoalcaliphilus JW-YL-7 = DSM 7308 TaxID=1121328 RepID=A0A150FSV1_CLOPD|nr:Lipoprotein LpqB, GerMN domain-containing protein [[Clostridium] paradoxum JW-YL-7 = DSM 7308]SHL02097.1 Spore germination protein GerM [[Clostridium] paradoxum JW-YL-7 = DSM 7308]
MKKLNIFIFLLTFIFVTTGCNVTAKNVKKEEIKLYYANSDNTRIQWVTRPINYSNEDEKYANALKELINGPYSSDSTRNISENTKVLVLQKNDDIIHVDFSKEFLSPSTDISQTIAIITVTNTLTQFDEVKGVRITVEGKAMISPQGQPYDVLTEFDLSESRKVNIKIYLPDENAQYLIPKIKEIEIKEGESIGEKIIYELIEESNSQDYNVIPKGTELIAYSEENKIAIVNFSHDFVNNHSGGTAGETMTIYSIVNSLTELENITGVLFLIEGQRREDFGHFSFNEPFRRAENLIKP